MKNVRTHHCISVKKGNLNFWGTLVISSICAIRICFSIAKEWRKFPPNTKESSGVYTAWIHPDGMKNVLPASKVIMPHFSTTSPKKISPCRPDNVHCSYAFKLASMGGMSQNTFFPLITWYHTDVPPKSMWKSIKS